MSKTGETVSFVYNEDGLRVQKTSSTKGTTNYTLHGKNVVHMTNSANGVDMHFFYDAQNRPAIVVYNGTPYYYLHNLQGDIIHIVDANGNNVVNYFYDAWGKKLSVTGSMAGSLGYWQPFRYRGYVYDEETGLFYLRSRYYDPAESKFISSDDTVYLGANGDLISYNLLAYCGSNPISGNDPDGTIDWGKLFTGGNLLAIGVTAIVVGVTVLTCGVAAPAMVAVATATVAAGAATSVNGISEIGEAVCGHNFMRDNVFQGDTNAYHIYSDTTSEIARVGTLLCSGWLQTNTPRIEAYKSMDLYNVKSKHLPSGKGNWSKFNTSSQTDLRMLGKEAIKRTPMNSLSANSTDSYRFTYDFNRVIGTYGETCARLVFSQSGKIITFFPQ